MKIKDLVVVTGMPGIQKIAANRNNGMLVEDIDTGVVRFAPIRKHQFSPLETISVYTDDNEAVELRMVLQSMLDKLQESPLPLPDAKPDELRSYFTSILPNHDQDKVHISDIKKIIRWFQFLNERGIFALEEESEEKEKPENTEEN